jgi:hypothetical protein
MACDSLSLPICNRVKIAAAYERKTVKGLAIELMEEYLKEMEKKVR